MHMEHISENTKYIKKKATKVVSQSLATKFGFVPDWSKASEKLHRAMDQSRQNKELGKSPGHDQNLISSESGYNRIHQHAKFQAIPPCILLSGNVQKTPNRPI